MRELDRRRAAAAAATASARARLQALRDEVIANEAQLLDVQQRRDAWLQRLDGVAAENYARYGVRAVGETIDRVIEKQVRDACEIATCTLSVPL